MLTKCQLTFSISYYNIVSISLHLFLRLIKLQKNLPFILKYINCSDKDLIQTIKEILIIGVMMKELNTKLELIDQHIGKKIYELRLARGMSRQELGQKIGVTHQQCQKYEKGTNRITAGRLMLIAKVLNKSIDYFYENIVEETSIPEVRTIHQRMCIEVSRNFMKIRNSVYQDAVNNLVKILAKEAS